MAHLSNFDRIRSTNTFVSRIVGFSLVGRSSILLQLQSCCEEVKIKVDFFADRGTAFSVYSH